jgi:hypothetical protein
MNILSPVLKPGLTLDQPRVTPGLTPIPPNVAVYSNSTKSQIPEVQPFENIRECVESRHLSGALDCDRAEGLQHRQGAVPLQPGVDLEVPMKSVCEEWLFVIIVMVQQGCSTGKEPLQPGVDLEVKKISLEAWLSLRWHRRAAEHELSLSNQLISLQLSSTGTSTSLMRQKGCSSPTYGRISK